MYLDLQVFIKLLSVNVVKYMHLFTFYTDNPV